MQQGGTALGVPPNVAAALAYALGWLSGIVVLLVEKENRHVRYHAAQSILVFGALTAVGVLFPMVAAILSFIPFLGLLILALLGLVVGVVWLATGVAWIALILFALLGRDYRVPYLDSYADRLAARSM